MKKLKMILVVAVLFGTTLAFKVEDKAPVARIGFTNPDKLMQSMDGVMAAKASIDTLTRQLQGELQLMLQAYKEKASALQQEQEGLNELVLKNRQEELATMQQSINEFQEKAAQAVQAKEQELLMPYANRLDEAIKAVAREKGYTHVFNATAAASTLVLYADEFVELDSLIMQQLAVSQNQ